VDFESLEVATAAKDEEVLAVDKALEKLAAHEPISPRPWPTWLTRPP
jgi:hypothetical protein